MSYPSLFKTSGAELKEKNLNNRSPDPPLSSRTLPSTNNLPINPNRPNRPSKPHTARTSLQGGRDIRRKSFSNSKHSGKIKDISYYDENHNNSRHYQKSSITNISKRPKTVGSLNLLSTTGRGGLLSAKGSGGGKHNMMSRNSQRSIMNKTTSTKGKVNEDERINEKVLYNPTRVAHQARAEFELRNRHWSQLPHEDLEHILSTDTFRPISLSPRNHTKGRTRSKTSFSRQSTSSSHPRNPVGESKSRHVNNANNNNGETEHRVTRGSDDDDDDREDDREEGASGVLTQRVSEDDPERDVRERDREKKSMSHTGSHASVETRPGSSISLKIAIQKPYMEDLDIGIYIYIYIHTHTLCLIYIYIYVCMCLLIYRRE